MARCVAYFRKLGAVSHLISCPDRLCQYALKYRDDSFDVKMAYYLGMFVGLLFMLAKLRYWR